MKILALLFLFTIAAFAQDVTTLLDAFNLLQNPPSNVLTVVAAQGDGTSCTMAKAPGSKIFAILACTPTGGSDKGETLKSTAAAVSYKQWGYGDVSCLLIINPTATAVAANVVSSLPAVPAVSVGWSCSTAIRTAGVYTGSTAIVTGSVSWP